MTEVMRILISIGPTETMHFQTWSDKAGNAPPLTAVDPVTGVSVTFPDLRRGDRALEKEPDHAGTMSVPGSEAFRLFRSFDQPRPKALPWVLSRS